MAILPWRKPLGPRITRKLWSNIRERIPGNEKRQGEDSSYTKGIEILLRETARKKLSNIRKRRQSHDCTSRLSCSSIWTSLGAPKQRSLDTTNRSVLALSNSCDHSPGISVKVTREFRSQRGQDRGDQEAEDSEKQRRGVGLNQMAAVILDLNYFILIFCLARITDWQSVDWDSSDQTRKNTTWQSHFSWQ